MIVIVGFDDTVSSFLVLQLLHLQSFEIECFSTNTQFP